MNIMDITTWSWCAQPGVKGVFKLVSTIISAIRFIVPIVLIVMTSLDISKKIINPEDKDGQKKIMNRAIAAVVIFFIPLLIKFVFIVIDWGVGSGDTYGEAKSNLQECLDIL